MRIKFILSFPEMYAVMICPLESCTLKVALGNDSTIFPSTSITSSLDTKYPSAFIFDYNVNISTPFSVMSTVFS